MKLKDLTKYQGLEISQLVYPFPELVKDIRFEYQEFDESMYEDACELVRIRFDAPVFGDKVYPLMIEIFTNLSLAFYYWTGDINEYLPVRNQYKIFEKFKEWGIEPEFE